MMRNIFTMAGLVLVTGLLVQASQDCIWVEPGGSIQAIINAAPSGSIVCLPDGIWMENLVIHKSLTLRGQGPERSRIQAKNIVEPIVWIRGSKTTPITVVIEGVMLLGQTVIALDGVEFVEYANVGIFVDGTAHITLQNCAFLGARNNLWFTDRAQALVINVWIHGEEIKTPKLEKTGIILKGQTQATILDTTISFLADGIIMEDMAQAIIERTTISNTLFGIHVRDAAQTLIVRTHITESEDGVVLTGRCQAQIVDCVIVNNKIGVALLEHAAVVLIGNRIAGNKLYGVLPALHDPQVWFAGFIAGANNVIPGPTQSNGNLMGAVYLEELLFLTTEAGGTWCQR